MYISIFRVVRIKKWTILTLRSKLNRNSDSMNLNNAYGVLKNRRTVPFSLHEREKKLLCDLEVSVPDG